MSNYYSDSDSSDEDKWITEWVNESCNRFLCEVPEEFIIDEFNLIGLPQYIDHYDAALCRLLDDSDEDTDADEEDIELDTQKLYGYIHQRYLTSAPGLKAMKSKYRKKHFGLCPRLSCAYQPLLPCGISERFGKGTVRAFCPKCENIYTVAHPQRAYLDGACFGPAFPHLFLMVYPELLPNATETTETGYEPILDSLKKLKSTFIQQQHAQQQKEGLVATEEGKDEAESSASNASPSSAATPVGKQHQNESGRIDAGESDTSDDASLSDF
ncbi:putative casein kinase II beta chain [Monocercomonoides exilis]|uniref:putative casein kinase II beta chain n=1 Tax=Monocercomonoides exilis TaxID=2049356 RepID=UPI00355A3DAF|nr:putative casein kinase II beta chain [Monocercomonoides exilis]|eukprot:MONOS_10053.1-p1 / transcript=MONOS_10053.1 / gene=MONOS_10053 / organism=Monocercomonoides_exilis_PA203 / gene_product=casein kinase II beta chain / transcript_product=casein kinase II beta chain / location=Mono_scaffold00440:34587-35475(+) / protein_length=269 / sequence_SO=supercontig / SO=protein_coding / is_pseudo=false